MGVKKKTKPGNVGVLSLPCQDLEVLRGQVASWKLRGSNRRGRREREESSISEFKRRQSAQKEGVVSFNSKYSVFTRHLTNICSKNK